MKDNLKTICCPACGKKMEKVFMPQQKVNLDVCLNGCGGIYFDNYEYKKFDECHEDIQKPIEAYEGKTFQPVDASITRICPVCGRKMVKNFASAKREIEIDECYTCGAKFLDYSELEKIRAQFNTEEDRAQHFEKTFGNKHFTELNYVPTKTSLYSKHLAKLFSEIFSEVNSMNLDKSKVIENFQEWKDKQN